MKIALIQLPHFYGKGHSRPPTAYPLGLGYISNALTHNNIEHEGIDLWGLQYSVEEAIGKIDYSGFDVLAISAYITQYKYLKAFSLKLKELYPDKPIICGGAGPTFSADIILKNTGVDVCILGEGEITTIDLLQNIKMPILVAGIVYKDKKGDIVTTLPREAISTLDTLPFPNRNLFDMEKIIKAAHEERSDRDNRKEWRIADIIAGRGCPYKCHYCSKTFEGLRLRSVENVMAEIYELKEKYRINHLQFNDELFLVNKKRILQFCEELKKTGMTWSCQGRINQVDETILKAMKEAGCIEVGYGVEAISQSILDNMNKRLKSELTIPAVRLTQKIGITPIIQYMYGYPGENDKTIEETEEFFKAIDHPYIGFTTTPIPGTKLYKDCIEKGLIKDEEEYILRLDSGYNIEGAMINMTEFSDKEFLWKKRILRVKVDHNYYIRRPLQYIPKMYGYFRQFVNIVINIISSKMRRFVS